MVVVVVERELTASFALGMMKFQLFIGVPLVPHRYYLTIKGPEITTKRT